ncbi:MAG TPA: hypothetical protein VFV33_11485, partial [Gemmatimonadaceae bacterium]|nr:hypothetical protein [Gemmatimonadaceae bacterium]
MRKLIVAATASALLLATGCATTSSDTAMKTDTASTPQQPPPAEAKPAAPANPLTAKWTGPYGGVPAFDQVKVADFQGALEIAMDEARKEIDAIARNPEAPNFENTIAAYDDAGRMLRDVSTYYGVWSSTMNGPEFQAVEREMEPKLA